MESKTNTVNDSSKVISVWLYRTISDIFNVYLRLIFNGTDRDQEDGQKFTDFKKRRRPYSCPKLLHRRSTSKP